MKYKIVRHYVDPKIPRGTIRRGLTLEEAQAHCKDPETSSRTCKLPANKARTKKVGEWFDSYTEE